MEKSVDQIESETEEDYSKDELDPDHDEYYDADDEERRKHHYHRNYPYNSVNITEILKSTWCFNPLLDHGHGSHHYVVPIFVAPKPTTTERPHPPDPPKPKPERKLTIV